MKKILVIIAVLVLSHLDSSAQKYKFEDLVGNWRNKAGVGLEVVDSFQIYVVYGEHRKLLQSYGADFKANPAKFNFNIKDSANKMNVKSNLLFINENTIQWQIYNGDTHPVGYSSDKGDLLILRKVEEKVN